VAAFDCDALDVVGDLGPADAVERPADRGGGSGAAAALASAAMELEPDQLGGGSGGRSCNIRVPMTFNPPPVYPGPLPSLPPPSNGATIAFEVEGLPPADQVTYEVPLRPDVKAKLTVPANITRVETIRIANFVRGLAVDVTDEVQR
jgi:hypothetical protein